MLCHGSEDSSALEARRAKYSASVLEFEVVLSLLEVLAHSSLGRRALRDLGPRSKEGARTALARVREMQELEKRGGGPSFAGVTDPVPIETGGRIRRSYDEERCMALRSVCLAGMRLADWFAERAAETPALARVAESLPRMNSLVEAIDQVLDERGRVRRDASVLLARLGKEGRHLSSEINTILRRIVASSGVRAVLSDSAVHRRGGRPVLAVRAKSSGRVRGLVHDRSQSGESVFIEPNEVVELGNRLAEVHADTRRETERILLELSTAVRAARGGLESLAEGLAELELASIGARSAALGGGRPALQPGDLGAAPGLLLRSARHPLLLEQERQGRIPSVVPIDVRLGGEFDMLIITGPNTGGKTLALKTAGLFALLTRCGLPVPAAEGTTVPLYERVAADIGDEQEIRQNLSTFASHLVRIKGALAEANSDSLVLLDELGGGTDPEEGAALGEAVLENLLERAVPTLCSTHIGKLKEFAFRHVRAENACTEFDVRSLEPRYRLLIGSPGESGALVIARRLGLPEALVERAGSLRERRDGELADLMEEVRVARTAAEELRAGAEARLDEARERIVELEDVRGDLDRRSEQLEAEAQKGIEERVRDGLRKVGRARALLSQIPKETAVSLGHLLDELEADLTGASLSERREAFLASLRKGSLVYLPRYRQRVLVHKINAAKREVVCKLGGMKLHVTFEEVTPYESL